MHANCMNACGQVFVYKNENSVIQHTCILNVFAAAAKICSKCKGKVENVKVLATLLT